MVASSVVSTILILNYHHRNADTHEMSEWVKSHKLSPAFLQACFLLLPFQVRVVFLYWLPCILRMSRPVPEEEDEDEKHQKAAKIQCVELKDRYVRYSDDIWPFPTQMKIHFFSSAHRNRFWQTF